MKLDEIAVDIRSALKNKRDILRLSFSEDKHIYYMLTNEGKITSGFPSVSKIIKNFFAPFNGEVISLSMAKGNLEKQKQLLGRMEASWRRFS